MTANPPIQSTTSSPLGPAQGLREESRNENSTIGWVVSPGLFIPENQDERLHQIARLREIADAALAKLSGDLKQKIESFRPLLDVDTGVSAKDEELSYCDEYEEWEAC